MFKRVGLPVPDGYPEVDNTETDNPKITRLNNNWRNPGKKSLVYLLASVIEWVNLHKSFVKQKPLLPHLHITSHVAWRHHLNSSQYFHPSEMKPSSTPHLHINLIFMLSSGSLFEFDWTTIPTRNVEPPHLHNKPPPISPFLQFFSLCSRHWPINAQFYLSINELLSINRMKFQLGVSFAYQLGFWFGQLTSWITLIGAANFHRFGHFSVWFNG